MILWALIYFSFGSLAFPTPSDIPIDISSPLFARDADKFGTRSIWNIIWSCFSTIFACTWIAVHPNIPGPKDSQWAVLRRRLAIMGYVLVTPEIVIFWATRQHFAARYFAKRHQKRRWTMTHALFVIMGGFTLHDEQGTPLRILDPVELERLSEAGRIKWPSITEAEIQDRSKGDHLSKGIVLMQTTWFIAQCIVRGAYRLEVTELEVATLAFAVITGVIYYLWWNKPLDVRCSIPIYLLKNDEKQKVESKNTASVSPVGIPPTTSCDLDSNRVNSQSPPLSEESQIPQQTLVINSQEPSQLSHDQPTTAPEFQSTTTIQQFSAFIRRQRQKHGAVLGLTYVFLLYPLRSFFSGFTDMLVSDTLNDSMPLRVPTFYAPTITRYNPVIRAVAVAICVAVIFGGIHCVAWSFYFPTLQEKLAWQISAASVAGLPILIWVFTVLLSAGVNIPSDNWQNISNSVFAFMVLAALTSYVIARIVLLVLPCIALRELNLAALVEIQWAAFLPHIG